MNTYRDIVYMCLDEMKLLSDDAYYTQDHIIFLADKYRALLLKKNYEDLKKDMPESNYQTLCLTLEKVQGTEGDICSGVFLRSKETIPNILSVGTPTVSTMDYFNNYITFVSKERLKFVGYNKYLKNFIYCAVGTDNKLYLKSSNAQMYYLENIKYTAVFEDSAEAAKFECENKEDGENCDILDAEFPLEEALIPLMIEFVVKELSGAAYKPEDDTNDANDDLSLVGSKSVNNGKK